MTDGEKRRCPWCWEWIDRSAETCEHCKKEVQARPERQPATDETDAQAAGAPGQDVGDSHETGESRSLHDMSQLPWQLTWWATALLIYGVLLFGVALAYPAPRGIVAVTILLVQLAAAYLLNRLLWSHMKTWARDKITRTIAILAGLVALLIVLGWVRRQFL